MPQFTLKGLGVSEGIAFGLAHFIDEAAGSAPLYKIPASRVKKECECFIEALATSAKDIETLKRSSGRKLPSKAAEEISYILQAHERMLTSNRLLEGIKQRISKELINAEAAVARETESIAAAFEGMADPYLAARSKDIRELGSRLIAAFRNHRQKKPQADSILLAKSMDPASAALLDPRAVVGIAAASGGADSHTAIIARAMMMPAVLGAEAMARIKNGDELILDGGQGRIIVHPTAAVRREYRRKKRAVAARVSRLRSSRSQSKARTKDGVRIGIYANIELPRETEKLADFGAEGVGLMRSEFLFMGRKDLPSEEEQYRFIKQALRWTGKSPVVVRTLDVGGDKLAPSLGAELRNGGNSALGLRAIRLSLKYPTLFKTQIAAILRAAASAEGEIKILLPMVSSLGEITKARKLIDETYRLQLAAKRAPKKRPLVGIMVETPSAVMLADKFAAHCDFFAIGTNDLTMYTLAIDRDNEEVASLYDPLHPSLLRMIQMVCQAGWDRGIPVSICGEIAADLNCTALLVGLGVMEFSMAPSAINAVKEKIASIDCVDARRLAQQALVAADPRKISQLLDLFNRSA